MCSDLGWHRDPSAVLISPRLVTRVGRGRIAESIWENGRCASPDFVIQLRCLAGGLDLRGDTGGTGMWWT